MQFISCHHGKLQTLDGAAASAGLKASPTRSFVTGLAALDGLAPQQRFARGGMHELLFERSDGQPKFVAALIAQAASSLAPSPLQGEGWGEGISVTSRVAPFADRVNAAMRNAPSDSQRFYPHP